MEEDAKTGQEYIIEKAESEINQVINTEGLTRENVDYIYKLVDIHKDLKNEKYWNIKEEKYNDEIRRELWCKKKRRKKYIL